MKEESVHMSSTPLSSSLTLRAATHSQEQPCSWIAGTVLCSTQAKDLLLFGDKAFQQDMVVGDSVTLQWLTGFWNYPSSENILIFI